MRGRETIAADVPSRRQTFRNVSVLVSGTVMAQGVTIIAAPLLTRIYSPHAFGLLGIFIALLMLLTVIMSLRYEQAIPLPEDDRDAGALLLLSLGLALLTAAVVAVPLLYFGEEFARLLNAPELASYFYLVPLGGLLAGGYNILQSWAIRTREFGALAATRLSQSLTCAAIQAGASMLGPGALLIGQTAGGGMGLGSLGWRTVRPRLGLLATIRWRDVTAVGRRYKHFPLLASWAALFNTTGSQLPPLLFAALFDPVVAGMYSLANRVLSMPMLVLGKSIASVFLSGAAQAWREGRFGVLVAGVHGRLAQIGMPPAFTLALVGPQLFGRIFGDEWREAGVIAQWLAPWLYLVFVTSPLCAAFDVLGRQAAGLNFQLALLGMRASAIAFGAWKGDARLAIVLFALVSACCWSGQLLWILRASGSPGRAIRAAGSAAIGWSLLLNFPLVFVLVRNDEPSAWTLAIAAVAVMAAVRYGLLIRSALR
ncbi:lipopolysaccharide biosynthesis protein [Noviherbaspirillum aerium]|uniref:lipopolysaccharide biosynthesis protein n=1 Tax=Noviherbaspirillum aerium TaxID=2588497 RepID=UPI00124E0CCA|nr:oligosaccharide flippase family protein [Noviherbaspirillum aerium]